MPEQRDPTTQYDMSQEDSATLAAVDQAMELVTSASWEELLRIWSGVRSAWDDALEGLTGDEADRTGAEDDEWTPALVLNHQGGFLRQAAHMMRGAVLGIHQTIEDIDGQWLGDDIGFADLQEQCAAEMAEFDAAARAAANAPAAATVTTPYLERSELRLWMRNAVFHTAEHVAQMRKVRGAAPDGWREASELLLRLSEEGQ